MAKPELTGAFPVYDEQGIPVAFIPCYQGHDERCRRRALAVGRAIAKFDGNRFVNETISMKSSSIMMKAPKSNRG